MASPLLKNFALEICELKTSYAKYETLHIYFVMYNIYLLLCIYIYVFNIYFLCVK